MPSQQKALYLESKGGQLVVNFTEVPTPGPGELLVKVEAAALNPIDWQVQTLGVFIERYPCILGIDGAGTVVQLGAGVTSFVVGDRIAFQGALDPVQKSLNGTFSQYTTTAAHLAAKIPANIQLDRAASIPVALPTAALVLYNEDPSTQSVRLTPPWVEGGRGKYYSKSALILGGSSSIGQYVIQLARLSGFSPIIATASPHNREYLESLGATSVIDRNLPSAQLQVEATKLADGLFDLVYDAVSLPDTLPLANALTAPEGDLVVVSPSGLPQSDETSKKVHLARGLLATPTNRVVGASLLANIPNLFEGGDIEPNRIEILSGGLSAVASGLERLKSKQVSGTKLVVLPQETI
ncbi:GroES-like protein [Dichomitus squalens]|uniref:GroES-like protein n=1 Tax=Dichomitus squalens TaxID=114155 RepID=A0A4Q9NKT8_9APHY|nr:GroES-like protein [Dichomitus squalens]TBU55695.1 GroES-like protein [Dichomitus squalens]